MAYRFHLKAPVGKEARRIILEQVERAERQLEAAGENPRASVHETRKAMKRIRALLKLIRPGLADEQYQTENARFRDIGALLAASRDQAVLIETLHKLAASHEDLAEPIAILIRHVSERTPAGAGDDDAAPAHGVLETALQKLHATKHHIRRIRIDPDSFDVLDEGLRQGFKRALRAEAKSRLSNDDEDVHAWRKAVQQHWRHMALLQRAWPDHFQTRVTLSRRISQLLGDDHDLSMLVIAARALPPETLPELHQQALIEAALQDQHRHRDEARLLSGLLFTGRPGAFARHIRQIWEASRALPEEMRPKRLSAEAPLA